MPMPITWKKKNFKPKVILDQIASIRTVSPGKGVSFSGFGLDDALPALQSMLLFPDVANEVNRSTIVWKALASITGELTPTAFLAAANGELSKRLATRQSEYHILTALSVARDGLPTRVRIDGSTISFLKGSYPKKYESRLPAIAAQHLPVAPSPSNYCAAIVSVTAKSPHGAITKALRALDLQRAIWCLMCNPSIQLGGQDWIPINVIRLGSIHTIHYPKGEIATDTVWFEPNYLEAPIFKLSKPEIIRFNATWALRRLTKCQYQDTISDALLRFVRAFDERDQNTAFLRLWGALEALTVDVHLILTQGFHIKLTRPVLRSVTTQM